MDKNSFRKVCLNQKIVNRYYYSKTISKSLLKIVKNYKNILLFMPLENEVNIKDLIHRLKFKGKNIFIPFMQDLSFKMVKYHLPLTKKKFNILEPKRANKTLQKIDLAIVPVVGVDSSFKRVGFGKGMYDRFFETLPYKPKIVFLQLKPCFSKQKLTDKYDIRADYYVSFNIRRKNNDDSLVFSSGDIIHSRGIYISKKDRFFKI